MCARMLKAQNAYGSQSARSDEGPICLGRNLQPTLPEDKFDRKPFERGPLRFVADVRLDNRSELASALGVPSQRAAALSDSELLFDALVTWGEEAVGRLAGEFAFVLWNSADESLLLARDLFGFRPLYFHRASNFFAFATMPSGLHAIPEVPYGFDANFVAETLLLLPQVGTSTFYRDIERVEPATIMRVTRKGITSRRYWSPPLPISARLSARDYEEGLRAVVGEAVQAQLRGAEDGVASHLSSGLDSSIVATTAAQFIKPGKLVAFTSVPRNGFDGPVPRGSIANEGELAAQTASLHPNIEHVLVESSADTPLTALDRNHAYYQSPAVNLDNDVWGREINRLASSRGLKVLLVGNFGNMGVTYPGMEWLSWLVTRGRFPTALSTARSLARNGVPWRTLTSQLVGPFLPVPLWKLACRIFRRPLDLRSWSAVSPGLIPPLEDEAYSRGFDPLRRPSVDPLEYRLKILFWVDLGNYFKGVLGEWGLSVRDPLSDRRVIEYCLSLPTEEFIRGGIPRSLARRTFADRIPRRVIDSVARGYQSPDWYEAVARNLPLLQDEIDAIARCRGATEVTDIDWLKNCVATWPSEGWAREDVRLRYRYGLLRGVLAGHFMRRVEGSN